jgi:hypothetical protein
MNKVPKTIDLPIWTYLGMVATALHEKADCPAAVRELGRLVQDVANTNLEDGMLRIDYQHLMSNYKTSMSLERAK